MTLDLKILSDKKKFVCMSRCLFYGRSQDFKAIPHAQSHNLIVCAKIHSTTRVGGR